MKRSIRIILAAAVIIIGAMDAMAIEEATYNVVKKDNKFEIRDYAPHILAETVVEGDLEEAGNKAFNRLFRYISGDNRSRDKVAMTAPVSQEPVGEKIKMTAPVGQQRVQERWAVSFMMPASYTLETLPEPDGPQGHVASGSSSPDGRSALLRFLEREELPSIQVGTGVLDSRKGPYHCGRSHMGPLQPPFYPLVLAAERDSDSGRCRH